MLKKALHSSLLIVFFLPYPFVHRALAQEKPVLKNPDGRKFGSSLKQFEEKSKTVSDPESDDVIRVQTNLVIHDYLVVNEKGNVILGLKAEDFLVSEDGVEQKIEMFGVAGTGGLPKHIVMIIENGGVPTFVKKSANAAAVMVDMLGPNDRMAIVSDNVELVVPFTGDKDKLKKGLKRFTGFRPSRREFSSLIAVLKELLDDEVLRPIVVLQASGDEAVLLKPIWPEHQAICDRGFDDFCERKFNFEDLMTAVEKSRATIYSVVAQPQVINLPEEQRRENVRRFLDKMYEENQIIADGLTTKPEYLAKWEKMTIREAVAMQNAMFEVGMRSGGSIDFIENPDGFEAIYKTIFTVAENRYTIGYYMNADSAKRKRLSVSVRNHPEYKVLGRRYFIAPSADPEPRKK